MDKVEPINDSIDWRLTTWEGARREQLRRWAELPLERVILALEEMQDLADWLAQPATAPSPPAQEPEFVARAGSREAS